MTPSPTTAPSGSPPKIPTSEPFPGTALFESQGILGSLDHDDASGDNIGSSKILYIIMFGTLGGAFMLWKFIPGRLQTRKYMDVNLELT